MPPDAVANRRFAEVFSGQIIRRDDPEYDLARVVWNGMIDRYPELVVRPASADDVAAAVRFAREEGFPIAVRSGGHSIPGLSTCDDGIVIDLSRMNGARVDAAERTAWVNGGALLGELDREAQAVGLVCPVGVVSHTGVAGLTLGGGMGRLQRKHGLTIDNLIGVELVTADGRHVRASEAENEDLFWGMRGAGSNFGIVTAFRFRLHPLAWPVTHGALVHPIERATDLAARVVELVAQGPDELWASFGLARLPEGRPAAMVTVLHSGAPEDAERDLAELRAFGPPLSDSIEPKPHLAPQTMADEEQRWGHRFSIRARSSRRCPTISSRSASTTSSAHRPAGTRTSPSGRAAARSHACRTTPPRSRAGAAPSGLPRSRSGTTPIATTSSAPGPARRSRPCSRTRRRAVT